MKMIKNVKMLFRDKQFRLFVLLTLTTLFNFLLVGFRWYYTRSNVLEFGGASALESYFQSMSFLFLVWNLFLAWIPYWISLSLEKVHQAFRSKILTGGLIITWLLFFPNAPYILTDLLHLRMRAPVPHWYDMMMLISFAWNGLILGLISLHQVHQFFSKRMSSISAATIIASCIGLTGFGIWLGRFQRWNSWDILTNPYSLVADIAHTLAHPMAYMRTLGMAIVLTAFLSLCYLTIVNLMSPKHQ